HRSTGHEPPSRTQRPTPGCGERNSRSSISVCHRRRNGLPARHTRVQRENPAVPAAPPPADGGPPWGRFDDLVRGTALRFEGPSRVLTATEPADVAPVLAEVERATDAGSWAFGYV